MESTTVYKNRALDSLRNKWAQPVLCTLAYYVIAFAINFPSHAGGDTILPISISLFLTIALIPLIWSFEVLFLDFIRQGETHPKALLLGYNSPWWPKSLYLTILVGIYTFLWTLLLIIPGIIKSYSYALAPMILRDNSDIKCEIAIEKSMRIMYGHKMEMFLLDLSFVGWLILSILTMGIGMLWLIPYWQSARMHFYEDLLIEYKQSRKLQP